MFSEIRDKHGGMVPSTMKDLTELKGVGTKTATLLLNEGFGFFAGIGTDKHVCQVSLALGLFSTGDKMKHATPNHVEASLRTWIHQSMYKETNKIFGGMAQILTQRLLTVNTQGQKDDLEGLLQVIFQRFSTYYELELIWFMIGRIRHHYIGVAEKRKKAEEMDEEESDDEMELE
jgi:endonuclease III